MSARSFLGMIFASKNVTESRASPTILTESQLPLKPEIPVPSSPMLDGSWWGMSDMEIKSMSTDQYHKWLSSHLEINRQYQKTVNLGDFGTSLNDPNKLLVKQYANQLLTKQHDCEQPGEYT